MGLRQQFPGHYRPTKDEFDKLWHDAIFAFDANVLLDLYRYSPDTCAQFFNILDRLRERIWLPHRAADEYLNGRLDVITRQLKTFGDVEKLLNEALEKLNNQLTAHESASDAVQHTRDTISQAQTALREAKEKHPNLLADDSILDRITELFEDRTGCAYTAQELEAIHKAGEERYKTKTPPGFADASKGGTSQYGDLVIWRQLVDQAKSQKKPIILITDDRKEDWWQIHEGSIIGPHPQLVGQLTRMWPL